MALQLGFDGNVKLTAGAGANNLDSLRECLQLTADKYRGFTAAIDASLERLDSFTSDRTVYWRITFAILSVHSPIDATFEAYKALRAFHVRFGRVPSQQTLKALLLAARGADGVVQYTYQKAKYIREFDASWRKDKTPFLRNGDSDDSWRRRIQANVKGLGLAKASFAVALASPSTSDVCCIDTHIYALFTGKPAKSSIGKRLYLELEERIRQLGKEFGLSTFATQWCLWDARRGVSNPHACLAIA